MSTDTKDNCPRGPRRGPYGRDVELSIEAARKFYAADSKLSTEDRKELYQSFWRSGAVRPFGGLALAWVGAMTPIWMKRRGMMNPKKQTRGLQVLLGFSGLFFGQGLSAAVGYNYYYYKFSKKNMNQATAWGMMGLVPSRLPTRYYELTSRDPRYIMKDPDTIDWRNEMMFPLNLVAHRDRGNNVTVYGDRKAGEYRPASSTYGQLPSQAGQTERDSFLSEPQDQQQQSYEQQPPYQPPRQGQGSSWDRVRLGGSKQQGAPADQGWLPPPLPEQQQQQQPGYNTGATQDPTRRELEEEQAKFDEMLEKARTGAGVGEDDFTESEKKWR